MTDDQYWNGDPKLASSYREAYKMKQKSENEKMWLQGLYIYDGVAALLNTDKTKRPTYPKEPYQIFEPTKEEKEAKAERERKKIINQLTAFKDAWDRQHG